MKTLFESQVKAEPKLLDVAWDDPDTFLFLPEKSGVLDTWIRLGIEQLPKSMQTGHFILLTSGSTGQPKMVVGSRERAEALVRIIHEKQDGEPAREAVLLLPLNYCYAFVNQWLWSRVFHRRLVVTQGLKEPDKTLQALTNSEDGMLCLVYAQIPLFQRYWEHIQFPGIIRLHFAGGPFPQKKIDIVQDYFPNALIFNNYGCAEAMPRLTIRKLEESDQGDNIGRPLPGIEMKTGADGEILFRGPYGSVGYYDDDGFHIISAEDWIPTGDLGEEIKNGYWKINGRANEVFKRYGEKISLPNLLNTVYGNWKGHATFYREMEKNGEEGHVLVVSPSPTDEEITEVLQGFRMQHPRTHWPIRLESTKSLPLLENGKVDLTKLKAITSKMIHWRQRV